MTVISASEYSRMVSRAGSGSPTAHETRAARLKELSDSKVLTWPNTLEAMRKKKESWKVRKLEEEERRRVVIDEEEAALHESSRRAAIERAKGMLYEQTDKVKGMRSRMLYSEVLEHRKAQVVEKGERVRAEGVRERQAHEELIAQLEASERRDASAKAAQRAKAETIAKAQREQLYEYRDRHVARLVAEKKEGELCQKRAAADVEADRALLEKKLADEKVRTRESLLANEELKALKLAEARAEEEAEAKRLGEVKRKAWIESERKRIEQERFEARQASKQRLIDKATEELKKRLDMDTQRLERQVEELRRKEDDAAAAKQASIDKQRVLIDESRRQQLARRAVELEAEGRQVQDMVQRWRAKTAEIEAEEALDAEKRRLEQVDIKRAQEAQIRAARLARAKAKAEDLAADERAASAATAEDARFRRTLESEIDKADKLGKPTLMLQALLARENKLAGTTGATIQPASGLKV